MSFTNRTSVGDLEEMVLKVGARAPLMRRSRRGRRKVRIQVRDVKPSHAEESRRQGEYPSCFEGTVLTYQEEENECAVEECPSPPANG